MSRGARGTRDLRLLGLATNPLEGASTRFRIFQWKPYLDRADILLIHRQAFPLGWRLFFHRVEGFPGPVVYDYDDAMFLHQRQGRGLLSWLEMVDTIARVMALSDVVGSPTPLLSRGLAYAFYVPFPWEWFIPGGDTGAYKTLAGVETLLMIALTPSWWRASSRLGDRDARIRG